MALVVLVTACASPSGSRDGYDGPYFTDIARVALKPEYVSFGSTNGVAIFDYDRDGDLDLYFTNARSRPNRLYHNNRDRTFTDTGAEAGVQDIQGNGRAVAACDFDNDGYQDLYVGNGGVVGDNLDFRSEPESQGSKDRLFHSNRDGTFTDITDRAFGAAVNYRSTTAVACADVDRDGFTDIYVANDIDPDFAQWSRPDHPGHYNVLYRNNGNLTFSDITTQAGVQGPPVRIWDSAGNLVVFKDRDTGAEFLAYDPDLRDASGNRVGDPTGMTMSVLFFDYDDDGDADLWVANDGSQQLLFRNDTKAGIIKFTEVGHVVGVDKVGALMGYALGDYDGDGRLDVFSGNYGPHHRDRPPAGNPAGDCKYAERYPWGTCLHALYRNQGVRTVAGLGEVGDYRDVAGSIQVVPSRILPPRFLQRAFYHPTQQPAQGLQAYEFAFGDAFVDYDNDGDQDLYWLGSIIGRGEGPGGEVIQSAGRLLRNDGEGNFEDVTVEAHVLDIVGVDYSILDLSDPRYDAKRQRIAVELHENGKGLAYGDLDRDGFVDLVATNSSGLKWQEPEHPGGDSFFEPGPAFVWMNSGGENNWLALRLRGRMGIDGSGSNADGIGARVYVSIGARGKPNSVQVQELQASGSFLSMHALELYFGLGSAGRVERIEIQWPSGREQVLSNVQANQVLQVIEPTS